MRMYNLVAVSVCYSMGGSYGNGGSSTSAARANLTPVSHYQRNNNNRIEKRVCVWKTIWLYLPKLQWYSIRL